MPGTHFSNDQATGVVRADGFSGAPAAAGVTPVAAPASFPQGIGSGTTIGPAGVQGKLEAAITKALTVTAVTNTDTTTTVPTGALIVAIDVYTTTAFGAVTDAVISVGSTAAGNDYVTATSIKAAGVVRLTLAATTIANLVSMPSAATPNVFIRIAQSGGNSATGAATLVIRYLVP